MSKHRLYSSNQSSPALKSSEEGTPGSQSTPNAAKKNTNNNCGTGGKQEKNKIKNDNSTKENMVTLISDLNSDSDSDSMDDPSFFSSKTNIKLPYSMQEDEMILKFVLTGQNIYKTSSISLWKRLESLKVRKSPKRTYQSLKNRFLRNMKPFLFTTYSHLITDDETVQKILEKFPELKKCLKRDALPGLKLPKRVTTPKPAGDRIPNTSVNETPSTTRKQTTVGIIRNETESVPPSPSLSKSPKLPRKQPFRRRVEFKGNTINVTFHRDEKTHSSSKQSEIYKSYLRHKSKNVLVQCPSCGRYGEPEENGVERSDNESDGIIVNSVESPSPKKALSNNSSKNSGLKKRNSKLSSSVKNAKKSKNDDQLSEVPPCSPSLLQEISLIEKISEDASVGDENHCVSQVAPATSSSSADRKGGESLRISGQSRYMLSEREIDMLYQETLAYCQKLVESEEEEAMVHNCLKQNCNAFEFQPSLSSQKMNVESFFVNNDSPFFENISRNDTGLSSGEETTQSKSKSKSGIRVPKTPLAQNMAKMIQGNPKK